MILGTNKHSKLRNYDPKLTMNGKLVETVCTYEYLGVLLNNNLTLTEHVTQMIGIVSSKINTLAYQRKYIGQQVALIIYKGTIMPLMEYANSVFSLIPKTYLVKVQRLQNRALKRVFTGVNADIDELHIMAKHSPLTQRADKKLLLMMYRRSLEPVRFQQLENLLPTRSNSKIRFKIPRPCIERFPVYAGLVLWDTIAAETQRVPNVLCFKNRITIPPEFGRYPVR